MHDEDLSREIFPLSHYATNRGRLINEAFSVLRGHRLESTIPPSLRSYSYTELKAMCLEELEKIDTLRIVDIIEGRLTSSSKPRKRPSTEIMSDAQDTVPKKSKKNASSKESNAETSGDEKGKKKKKKKKVKEQKAEEAISKKKEAKKSKSKVKAAGKGVKKKSKGKKKTEKNKKKKVPEPTTSAPPQPVAISGERTLMELLELEYRAKAIKALLKFQGFGDTKLSELFDDKDPQPAQAQNENPPPEPSSSAQVMNGSSAESSRPSKSLEDAPVQMSKSSKASDKSRGESHKSQKIAKVTPTESTVPSKPTQAKTLDTSKHTPPAVSQEPTSPATSPVARNNTVLTMTKREQHAESDEKSAEDRDGQEEEEEAESKFELSIDIDEDLDYGNPDDLPILGSPVREEENEIPGTEDASSNTELAQTSAKQADEEIYEEMHESFTRRPSRKYKRRSRNWHSQSSDSENEVGGHLVEIKCGPTSEDEQNSGEEDSAVKSDTCQDEEAVCSRSEEEEGEISVKTSDDMETITSGEDLLDQVSEESNEPPPADLVGDPIKHAPADEQDAEQDAGSCEKEEPALPDDEAVEALTEYPPPDPAAAKNAASESENNVGDEDDSVNVSMPTKYPEEATPITWYERWYSSKSVQKVVTSTKMYGKLRNKLKSGKKNNSSTEAPESTKTEAKDPGPDIPIIGSIEEYEKLFGKKIVTQNLDTAPPQKEEPAAATVEDKPAGYDDDEEEEEDDPLWGDILGNND